MATIGMSNVYYALLLEDPEAGQATYDIPQRIVGAISGDISPNASSATLFADDGPSETASTMGEITLELNVKDIPSATLCVLLGHTYESGIVRKKSSDVPPWLALGFRSLKANGAYRYVWLHKGKFMLPDDGYATKGDSIEFNTPTITGSFVKRDSDDEWQIQADSDDPQTTQDTIDGWFESPNVPIGGGPVIPAPQSVLVSADAYTADVGETLTFKARIFPTNASQDVVWTSSVDSVATVSAAGVMTAVAPGSVTITATTVALPKRSAGRTVIVTAP